MPLAAKNGPLFTAGRGSVEADYQEEALTVEK